MSRGYAADVTDDWVPGDPLWTRENHPNSNYLFNFRSDTDTEVCNCPDAAQWPEPGSRYRLRDGDELGDLIDYHRPANELEESA